MADSSSGTRVESRRQPAGQLAISMLHPLCSSSGYGILLRKSKEKALLGMWPRGQSGKGKRESKLAICVHKFACSTGLCNTEPHGGSSPPPDGGRVAALADEDHWKTENEARCASRDEEDPADMDKTQHNSKSHTEIFHMRMSMEEKRRLEERARQWGKDNGYAFNDSGMMSRYAREVLLGPRRDDQALTHADLVSFKLKLRESQISMVKVGTLMNQIARVANSTGHIMHKELRESLVQMRHEIDRIEDTITVIWNRNR